MAMSQTTKGNVLITVGTILVIFCVIFMACFSLIFTSLLNKMLIVDPEGKMFKSFDSPGVPIYMDYYIFNVTNPEEVQHYGAKPKLVELGPYIYLEKMKKHDYVWNDKDGTVEYLQDTTYFFDAERSKGKLSDPITTLNAVMVVLGSRIHDLTPGLKAIGELFFLRFKLHDNLFITRTVSELLFEGYYDPLVELLGKISGDPRQAEGKFGFYYKKNGTDDGVYKVKTGALGMEDYLYIQEWEHNATLDYWNDPYCNMINGTDGTQYPPGVDKTKTIRLFTTDLCRSISIDFEKEVRLHDTVLYRFVLPRSVLEITSKTKCFCKDEFTCRDSMVNVKACRKGAPIVLSTPHFYQGMEEDINKLDGLNPQKELHETYLDVEPTTGVVMEAAKRIQLNLPLRRYGSLPSFMNVPEVIFPLFWASENAQIPEKSAKSLNRILTLPYIIVYIVCGIIVIIGLILAMTGIVKRKRSKIVKKESSLLKK